MSKAKKTAKQRRRELYGTLNQEWDCAVCLDRGRILVTIDPKPGFPVEFAQDMIVKHTATRKVVLLRKCPVCDGLVVPGARKMEYVGLNHTDPVLEEHLHVLEIYPALRKTRYLTGR